MPHLLKEQCVVETAHGLPEILNKRCINVTTNFERQNEQKNPEDWSHYRRLRNLTTYAIRKEKANYERSVFNENESNPKNFWKQVKKCYPIKNKSPSNTSFKVENELITDKNKIPNAFCAYFSITYLP